MARSEKVKSMLAELKEQGVSDDLASPPLWRFLWRLGLNVPPPFYLPWYFNALIFGAGFGGIYYYFSLLKFDWTFPWVFSMCVAFGLSIAIYYVRKARKLNLSLKVSNPKNNALVF